MPTIIRSHRDLDVFANAMNAAVAVHHIAKRFPASERYSLTNQVLRSSRSVCANIAETWRKRLYPAHFKSKITDVQAEAAETQVWLELSQRISYIDVETFEPLFADYEKIIAQLAVMSRDAHKWTKR